jgi:hypothetical protein
MTPGDIYYEAPTNRNVRLTYPNSSVVSTMGE